MSVFGGIDLGTSGIKVVLVDEQGDILASASRRVAPDIPQPGWSQQHPDLWWDKTCAIFDELAAGHPDLMARLRAISLSGQMLGQVLIDPQDRPTTPCILWNDQRALAECDELLARVPDIGWRTNGQPDPGLTAPKLLWLAKHEPDALTRADMLMLPKDFVRLRLTGVRGSEVSDAAGTMMLDCATGAWDAELATAAGWDMARLPRLFAPYESAGELKHDLCQRWGVPQGALVAAGCGDNYAGALGIGAVAPGEAALSIGTSGVLSAVDSVFHPAPDRAILTTPHAAPDTFLSMGVVMSATQSLDWLSRLTGSAAADLAAKAEARVAEVLKTGDMAHLPLSRLSITGVRTPDNRPDAQAFLGGITAGHDKADIAYAILEGVAFQFYDSYRAQRAAGVPVDHVQAVGGGAASSFWVSLMATLLDQVIAIPEGGDVSACIGAAKLAQAAAHSAERDVILSRKLPTRKTVVPNAQLREALMERHSRYRELPFRL